MATAMSGAQAAVAPGGPAPSNVTVVAEALREAIVEGRLAAGERVKEVPLAAQMGVSRGPIRDALRLLCEQGLVEIQPNRGAVIPAIAAADVLEVYAMRAALGSLALHKLLWDRGPEAAAALDAPYERLARAVAREDEREAAVADLAFQTAIVAGAGLPQVAREFDRLTWHVRRFIAVLDMDYRDGLPTMLAEIEAIRTAIAAGDDAGAQRLWHEKFGRWVQDFIGRLPGERFNAQMWSTLTGHGGARGGRGT